MSTQKQRRRTPAQVAILKALGTRLNTVAEALPTPGAEQTLLREIIDMHRENLIRALLPNLAECTRGGWTIGVVSFPSAHSSRVYIDADFRRWRAAKGLDAPSEAEGSDALSLLAYMRPRLANSENLLRILGLCALDVLGATR